MGIFDVISSIFKKKPKIAYAKSQSVDLIELKRNPYYIVASVELGNTTTKSIITATNMETGKTYIVSKHVKMTRDVRPPKKGEEVFGETLWGVKLTREAVSDMVKEVLLESLKKAGLTVDDLHFVVRSTGVTAGFASPEEVGEMIIALAQGCMKAGVPPAKMTPAMTKDQIPKPFDKYSFLDKIIFDGAVTGVLPPTGKEVVANEMEGELVTAGIKVGSKWTDVDFRNPCMSIDFGTTLAGRITNDTLPYAKVIGNLCGLAGAIADAIARGSGKIDEKTGAALDLSDVKGKPNEELAKEYAEKMHKYIIIKEVPKDVERFGTVPVDPKAAEKAGTTLIGCDVGENGSDLVKLEELGRELVEKSDIPTLLCCLDYVMSEVVRRLVKLAYEKNLINEKSAIGITGRAGITGKKPELIVEKLKTLNIWDNVEENVVFVEDGLALGASVMARCMNCLGTPKVPIGGVRGGGCILSLRRKWQKERGMIRD
ncbi:MAG: methanogenesis marker 14 protein [Methanococci archaeon]|uniref:Methanogenesis marker protein 14 n=1 Tax=Methanocaldococcus vulcanius (strain ATCC 700851 / DSM 12094 / M7) TaxID=579137 RepID=C9RHD9_METVM|nr:methanogenesis marker 14 protein [Methanocaldococcus vulcanius]ACX72991.1 methanogenesis marker protein 14 [Methanocaldococcus vulcanius M7]NPA62936.1 methanogenesis marker 14 protein [Methanococci archaeon]